MSRPTTPIVVFRDPPAPNSAKRPTPHWDRVAAELRSHAGQWAEVASVPVGRDGEKPTLPSIRKISAFAAGEWESATRTEVVDGQRRRTLFVRFLGQGAGKEVVAAALSHREPVARRRKAG